MRNDFPAPLAYIGVWLGGVRNTGVVLRGVLEGSSIGSPSSCLAVLEPGLATGKPPPALVPAPAPLPLALEHGVSKHIGKSVHGEKKSGRYTTNYMVLSHI